MPVAERSPRTLSVVHIFRGRALRKLSHDGYAIFYAILADRIEVIRIVHGARDWAALFADPS